VGGRSFHGCNHGGEMSAKPRGRTTGPSIPFPSVR
jgi:hypothetical protein